MHFTIYLNFVAEVAYFIFCMVQKLWNKYSVHCPFVSNFGRNAYNTDACNAVGVAGLFPKVCQQVDILQVCLVSLKLTH
jgi:hypothetical protein